MKTCQGQMQHALCLLLPGSTVQCPSVVEQICCHALCLLLPGSTVQYLSVVEQICCHLRDRNRPQISVRSARSEYKTATITITPPGATTSTTTTPEHYKLAPTSYHLFQLESKSRFI